MPLSTRQMPSPVGTLTLVASEAALVAVLWEAYDPSGVRLGETVEASDHPILDQAEAELTDYFAGRREVFTVPLEFRGTDFQKRVWAELLAIPFGQTRSYAQVARALGQPTATRAVGAANGRNPIPIIAPCHRVIGSNGSLTGFGGGLPAKATLLALERPMLL